jgi:NADP-dependent 3-hydroxy acid dehydrogenase YdfG
LFTSIGAINILVNNAGIAHVGKADNTSEEDFDKIVNVNIKEFITVYMQLFHN